MKWYLVVFFLNDFGSFVFYEPAFNTVKECTFSANYPPHVQVYADKIVQEYGRKMPVDRLICINEEILKEFLKTSGGEIQA